MMSVQVSTVPAFTSSDPVPLFATSIWGGGTVTNGITRYDVTADGRKFLVNTTPKDTKAPPSAPITVVLNWNAGLKK